MSASDTVYVAGLPPDTTEYDLAQYFGQAGAVKTDQHTGLPRIWIYKDSQTGLPKGDAVVSYDDPYAAASAIQYFHQRPMKGSILHVNLAPAMDMGGGAYMAVQSSLSGQGLGGLPQGQGYFDPSSQTYIQQGYGSSLPYETELAQSSKQLEEPFNGEQGGTGHGQRGAAGTRGRGRKITAAPQGPARLFGPDDWPCPSCGNTNWARRPRCNLCGAPKPGTLDMKREGQAGGFKELDEEEIEDARRRRKALEEADDGELYDDYGRIKKKYRGIVDKATREESALARLRGDYDPSPSGQELAAFFKQERNVTEVEENPEEEKAQEQEEPPDPSEKSKDAQEVETEHLNEEPDEAPIKEDRDYCRSRSNSESKYEKYRARKRSVSPNYRARRRVSPNRARDSYRSRRSDSHRSRDREDRYRHRR